jgi:hypothetical protein
MATSAIAGGASERAVQRHGHWKSPAFMASYVDEAERFDDTNPTRFLGCRWMGRGARLFGMLEKGRLNAQKVSVGVCFFVAFKHLGVATFPEQGRCVGVLIHATRHGQLGPLT